MVAWFLASRLAQAAVGLIAATRFPSYAPARPWPDPPAPLPLAVFARWDSQWFFALAARGYTLPHGHFAPYVFFPLLPALLHLLPAESRGWGGVLMGAALGLAACLLLAVEGAALLGPRQGLAASLALLAYPLSFLLSAPYTEAPFLLESLGCLAAARRGRWGLAAAVGALAALTRNLGFGLALPLAMIAWRARREGQGLPWTAGLAVVAPLMALVAFALYLGHVAGSPLAFLVHEHAWGRQPALPWAGPARAVQDLLHPHGGPPPLPGHPARRYSPWDRGLYDAWDLGALTLGALALAYAFRRRLFPPLLAWGAFLLVAPLFAPTLHGAYALASTSRYVMDDYPVFLGLGAWIGRHRSWGPALLLPLATLGGIAFALYATWNWIA